MKKKRRVGTTSISLITITSAQTPTTIMNLHRQLIMQFVTPWEFQSQMIETCNHTTPSSLQPSSKHLKNKTKRTLNDNKTGNGDEECLKVKKEQSEIEEV